MPSPLSSSPAADRPHFPAFPDTSRIWPLREKARAASLAPCTHCATQCPRAVRTCRRRASSTDRGGKLIGDRTTPACAPSNVNMIPKAFSSFTTGGQRRLEPGRQHAARFLAIRALAKALLPDHVYLSHKHISGCSLRFRPFERTFSIPRWHGSFFAAAPYDGGL